MTDDRDLTTNAEAYQRRAAEQERMHTARSYEERARAQERMHTTRNDDGEAHR